MPRPRGRVPLARGARARRDLRAGLRPPARVLSADAAVPRQQPRQLRPQRHRRLPGARRRQPVGGRPSPPRSRPGEGSRGARGGVQRRRRRQRSVHPQPVRAHEPRARHRPRPRRHRARRLLEREPGAHRHLRALHPPGGDRAARARPLVPPRGGRDGAHGGEPQIPHPRDDRRGGASRLRGGRDHHRSRPGVRAPAPAPPARDAGALDAARGPAAARPMPAPARSSWSHRSPRSSSRASTASS